MSVHKVCDDGSLKEYHIVGDRAIHELHVATYGDAALFVIAYGTVSKARRTVHLKRCFQRKKRKSLKIWVHGDLVSSITHHRHH